MVLYDTLNSIYSNVMTLRDNVLNGMLNLSP